jgi:hypothetical protein
MLSGLPDRLASIANSIFRKTIEALAEGLAWISLQNAQRFRRCVFREGDGIVLRNHATLLGLNWVADRRIARLADKAPAASGGRAGVGIAGGMRIK